jgi:hypothetical protein
MVASLLRQGYSEIAIVFIAPCYFGIGSTPLLSLAHLHHAFAHYKQSQDLVQVALVASILPCLI